MERKPALALAFAWIFGGVFFLSGCNKSHSLDFTEEKKQSDSSATDVQESKSGDVEASDVSNTEGNKQSDSDSVATDVQEHISGNIEVYEDIQPNDVIASEQNFTYFSDVQLQQLFSLRDHNNENLKIVVPSYIPKGFRLVDVQADPGGGDVGPASYTISYQDQLERCFTIAGLAAPIAGPPIGDEIISLSNETFGEINLEYTSFDESSVPPIIGTAFYIPVVSNRHRYKFEAMSNMLISESVRCADTVVSLEEAAAIVESLQYLN